MARVAAGIAVSASLGFGAAWGPFDEPIHSGQPVTSYVTVTVQGRYQGRTARQWHARAVRRTRERDKAVLAQQSSARTVKRQTLLLRKRWTPTVRMALAYARAVYGVDLTRRAYCESRLDPWAHNASGASGLMQFLHSTWASTPFGRFSIWDPVAQALAGGWMIRAGRSSEWACPL